MYERERILAQSQDNTVERNREPPLSETKKSPKEVKMVDNMIDQALKPTRSCLSSRQFNNDSQHESQESFARRF